MQLVRVTLDYLVVIFDATHWLVPCYNGYNENDKAELSTHNSGSYPLYIDSLLITAIIRLTHTPKLLLVHTLPEYCMQTHCRQSPPKKAHLLFMCPVCLHALCCFSYAATA